MVVGALLIGAIAGLASAAAVLIVSGQILWALLAYSVGGSVFTLLVAVLYGFSATPSERNSEEARGDLTGLSGNAG